MDDTFIGVYPTEATTDDSQLEVDDLSDFDSSSFDLEETLDECLASSACVRSENRTDGKHLIKVWNVDKKLLTKNRCCNSKMREKSRA